MRSQVINESKCFEKMFSNYIGGFEPDMDNRKKIERKFKRLKAEEKKKYVVIGGKRIGFKEYSNPFYMYQITKGIWKTHEPHMITYTFNRNFTKKPNYNELRTCILEHQKRISSKLINCRRWHKHPELWPQGFLFLDTAYGAFEQYTPHYHGLMWLPNKYSAHAECPRRRYELDMAFQKFDDNLCQRFHIQKVKSNIDQVIMYCKRHVPFHDRSIIDAGHELIFLPDTSQC